MAVADRGLLLVEARTGRQTHLVPYPESSGDVRGVALSPDQKLLAIAMEGGESQLYRLDRRRYARLALEVSSCTKACFASPGLVVFACGNGAVAVVDLKRKRIDGAHHRARKDRRTDRSPGRFDFKLASPGLANVFEYHEDNFWGAAEFRIGKTLHLGLATEESSYVEYALRGASAVVKKGPRQPWFESGPNLKSLEADERFLVGPVGDEALTIYRLSSGAAVGTVKFKQPALAFKLGPRPGELSVLTSEKGELLQYALPSLKPVAKRTWPGPPPVRVDLCPNAGLAATVDAGGTVRVASLGDDEQHSSFEIVERAGSVAVRTVSNR